MPVKLEEGIDLTSVGIAQGTDITAVSFVPVSLYRDLYTGLIAYFDFDEGSGNITYDKAGDHHGTIINGATWGEGRVGKALSFDGIDDYVACANPNLPIGAGPFTISAWVKLADGAPLDSDTNVYAITFKGGASPPLYFAFCLRGGTYNGLLFRIYDGTGRDIIPSTNLSNTIKDYKFHHVLVTRDSSGNAYLYFDGNVVRTVTNYTYNPDSDYNLAIGVNYGENNPVSNWFKGIIDELRIYNRYLDADEVKLLYELGRQNLELGQDLTNVSLQP